MIVMNDVKIYLGVTYNNFEYLDKSKAWKYQ